MYVAPDGAANNSGATAASAIPLLNADQKAVAGDTVCLGAGTYSLPTTFSPVNSGTASAWITYTSYDGAVTINWTGPASSPGAVMFHMYSPTFPNGPSYMAFEGLTLNGQNNVQFGFFCQNGTHMRYIGNTIENMGEAGIGSSDCDYQVSDHNIIYHNGYNAGWSSGISYYASQWFDQYSGLHNVISNNIIAGSYDNSSNHTDGNGIIMDTGSGGFSASKASAPSTLIVNNVVYGNGGRCIETNYVANIWVVNNTCYDNMLDLTLGKQGEIYNYSTNTSYYINNIADSWNNEPPYVVLGANNTSLTFDNNLSFGGTLEGVSTTGFLTGNPVFINPPSYNATAGGQYATTISPTALGNGLDLQAGSPAIGAGIDPISLITNNTNLQTDISAYIYTDINGNPRPVGGPFTLGAYQN
ncbi:MAG: right-handed parallel beta-helix repeat-containing protein [Silvibacterium sp.]